MKPSGDICSFTMLNVVIGPRADNAPGRSEKTVSARASPAERSILNEVVRKKKATTAGRVVTQVRENLPTYPPLRGLYTGRYSGLTTAANCADDQFGHPGTEPRNELVRSDNVNGRPAAQRSTS